MTKTQEAYNFYKPIAVHAAEETKPCRPRKGSKMLSCGQSKPLTAFPRNRKSADGRSNICRDCTGRYAAEARARREEDLRVSATLKKVFSLDGVSSPYAQLPYDPTATIEWLKARSKKTFGEDSCFFTNAEISQDAAEKSSLESLDTSVTLEKPKPIDRHLLLAVLFLLLAVALTGYGLGRLTYKAETRDWSTVHVPGDQS